MKIKIFFIAALIASIFSQSSFAQNVKTEPSQLLTSYYNLKDALAAGNANAAAMEADEFVKAANGIDNKSISESNINTLLKDAGAISASKDLKNQREHFAGLSANMLTVARSSKLSAQPVYALYCPMKKSYWLSSDKTVNNPYFGSAMPTCGSVKETISQ